VGSASAPKGLSSLGVRAAAMEGTCYTTNLLINKLVVYGQRSRKEPTCFS
jgi:hypothetical protein